ARSKRFRPIRASSRSISADRRKRMLLQLDNLNVFYGESHILRNITSRSISADRRKRMLLQLDNLNVFYGESHILRNISFEMEPGQVVCLMGRNGVGKTTL